MTRDLGISYNSRNHKTMKLIIGLGNPGKEYEATRHNCGFRVLDAIAATKEVLFSEKKEWQSAVTEITIDGHKALLVKPQTYMNRSGETVQKIMNFYKLEPEDTWIVADELDLPVGTVRVRHEGSSAGHNGLQSIIDTLGTDQFSRIRVGIKPLAWEGETEPPTHEPEALAFVLQSFTSREESIVERVIAQTASYITHALEQDRLEARTIQIDIANL